MMYKRIMFFCFVIVVTSCKTVTHDEVVGEYNLFSDFPDRAPGGKLILEDDDHFKFEHRWELMNLKSEGKWSIKNNKVLLNSFKNYKSDYFVVEEQTIDGQGYIQILDKDNYPIKGIVISINGNETMEVTDSEGKVFADEIKSGNIKKVDFFSIGVSNGCYKVERKETNCLIIKLFDKEYDKIYFRDEKLGISKKYIKLRGKKFIKK